MKVNQYYSIFKKAISNGFLHILFGNTLVKIIGMFPAIVIPLIITKAVYGHFAFADNIIAYLSLISGLGMSGTILRYCSFNEEDSKRKGYFLFGLKYGLAVNFIITIIACVLFSFWKYKYNIEKHLLFALIWIPFLAYVLDSVQSYLRANRENKLYSRLSVIFASGMLVFQITLGLIFNFNGIVAGRYLSYIVTLAFLFYFIKKIPNFNNKAQKINKSEKLSMINFAFFSMLASAFSMIIPINEQNIVNTILNNPNIYASYRFASLLPQAFQFIPFAVTVFLFPYFVRHQKEGHWIFKNTVKVTIALFIFMGAFITVMYIFTPQIIFIYNKEYMDSVPIMRLLLIAFGIAACFRMPLINILAAIGEIKFNFICAAASAILHVIIGITMVKRFGISGAAYGLLIVYILSSVAGFVYLKIYCNKLESKSMVTI